MVAHWPQTEEARLAQLGLLSCAGDGHVTGFGMTGVPVDVGRAEQRLGLISMGTGGSRKDL